MNSLMQIELTKDESHGRTKRNQDQNLIIESMKIGIRERIGSKPDLITRRNQGEDLVVRLITILFTSSWKGKINAKS